MEADTISKNGRSSKSQSSRVNIQTNVLQIIFSMKVFFILAFTVSITSISAQTLSGNISSLKGKQEVNVEIDFSETLVNNEPEESYISLNTKEKNDEEKAEWLNEWREELPEEAYSQFIKYLNNEINQKGITAGDFPNAEYTIHVKVINISPGVSQWKNSNVSLNISFLKTGQTSPIATIEYKRTWANWSNIYAHHINRICRAFDYVGMNLGKTISNNLK